MVILKTNQAFMEANRGKYPDAIAKLGYAFGEPVVLEDEKGPGGGLQQLLQRRQGVHDRRRTSPC